MKSRIILILASSIFWASLSSAQTDAVCEDLHSFSCAPGIYDDGTGTAASPGQPGEREMKDLIQLKEFGSSRAEALLAQSKSSLLRQYILSISGLHAADNCEGGDTSPSQECLKLMGEAMAQLALKDILPNPAMAYISMERASDARRLDSLLSLPEMKNLREAIAGEYLKRVGADDLKKRIESTVFPRTKELILEKLKTSIPDPKARKALMDKVDKMQFEGVDCSKSKKAQSLSGLMTHNAFAMPTKHHFKICAAYGMATSEFSLVHVVAHELAHSIDPCHVEDGPKGFGFSYEDRSSIALMDEQYPIPGLLSCLRSSRSVSAQNFNHILPPSNYGPGMGMGGGGHGGAAGAGADGMRIEMPEKSEPTTEAGYCRKMHSNSPSGDQVTEAFCDWLSTEVLADYSEKHLPKLTPKQMRTGYSNVWRGSCSFQDAFQHEGYGLVHPSTEKRVNRLILTHPKVRNQMNCPPLNEAKKIYCAPGRRVAGEIQSPVLQQPSPPKQGVK